MDQDGESAGLGIAQRHLDRRLGLVTAVHHAIHRRQRGV